ncbi:10ad4140-b4d8-4dbe-bca9-5eb85a5bcc56 [Thermothielavioides terrestris]|uniref:10ad4140-b4d8-4dbe-bca9-5eb85a5bcc56 n=1 Tax=Thermothielavioides terrestris TaxID=2587410 RepID=A0A446BS40_9PEZI|nr:10ad4140-b4d8-4dbe-bca9-5eb85a5bcc56 [Thermothielavioides terrestris]
MPPPPPGHDHPGCKRASGSPTWTVSGFRWDTGAVPVYNPDVPIQQYRPGYALHLGLINPATGQNMTCVQTIGTWAQANQSGSPYEMPFWGLDKPLWQECVDTHWTNQFINNYNTWTNVLLDPDTRRLYVDQTWYCDDEGPEHPIQYTANGSVPIPPLHCVPRTSLDEFDPFTNVVVNGSTCTADSPFPVSGTLVSQYTMAPYALTLPRPAAKRCTADSLNPDLRYIRLYAPLQFEYRSYKTLRDGEGLVAGRLEFLLWNVGQDTELACDGWNGRLNSNASIGQYDPNYWFDCREELDVGQSTEDPNRLRTRYARVNFDVGASLLRVNISWTCDDESPGRNVTFEALSEAKLPTLNCTVADAGTEDEATLCTWPDRWKSQDLPMPFVSFRAY